MRSAAIATMLLAFGTAASAAEWELTRRGSDVAIHPEIHDTEIMGTNIGCVTLSRREMRRFGYPGHAVFCEEASAGEVVGVVVNRRGNAICEIRGVYNNDEQCYDLTICNDVTSLCRRR
jgi:hypothetical protein